MNDHQVYPNYGYETTVLPPLVDTVDSSSVMPPFWSQPQAYDDGTSSVLLATEQYVSPPLTPSLIDADTSGHVRISSHSQSIAVMVAPVPPVVVTAKKTPACVTCHAHKSKCDGARPCGRCVKYRRADQCADREPQRRTKRTLMAAQAATVASVLVASSLSSSLPIPTRTVLPSPPAITPATSPMVTSSSSSTTAPLRYTSITMPAIPPDDIVDAAPISPISPLSPSSTSSSSSSSDAALSSEVSLVYDAPHTLLWSDAAPSPSSNTVTSPPSNDTDTTTSHITAAKRSASKSPVRKRAKECRTVATSSSSTGIAWYTRSPQAVYMTPRHIAVYDSSRVMRISLTRVQLWLSQQLRAAHRSKPAYDWLMRAMKYPMKRMCYYCTPCRQCAGCANRYITMESTTIAPVTDSAEPIAFDDTAFGDVFASGFASIFWNATKTFTISVPSFECLPVAVLGITLPLCDNMATTTALMLAHHRDILSTITAASLMQDMMAAKLVSGDCTTGGGVGSGKNADQKNSHSSSASQAHMSLVDRLANTIATQFPVVHERDPHSGQMLTSLRHLPHLGFSMTDEAERLTGYSRSEMIARLSALGWQADLAVAGVNETTQVFRNIFSGFADSYSLFCQPLHIVTKWSTVIKVTWIGKMSVSNGYRSYFHYMVPCGQPDASHPLDPAFFDQPL